MSPNAIFRFNSERIITLSEFIMNGVKVYSTTAVQLN